MFKKVSNIAIISIASIIYTAPSTKAAIIIPISNPSFESPNLSENSANFNISGWTNSNISSSFRGYNPGGSPSLPDGDQLLISVITP